MLADQNQASAAHRSARKRAVRAAWPVGGGEMGALIRSRDWRSTPLGQTRNWPQSLKWALDLILHTPVPMSVSWGREGFYFYNDAAVRMAGARHPGALGRPVREAWPELAESSARRLAAVLSGESISTPGTSFKLWRSGKPEQVTFDLNYSPLFDESGKPAGMLSVLRETTEADRIQTALHESEARQAFLLRLSDALRPLLDPVEVQGEAARLLGERLQANRALYAEVVGDTVIIHRDYVSGVPSMAGRYPMPAFGRQFIEACRRGEAYAVSDAESDPRLEASDRAAFAAAGVASSVSVGMIKNGRLVASFGVHSAKPREWTPLETELVRAVAERTWEAVERACAEAALRESERALAEAVQRQNAHMDNSPLAVVEFDPQLRVIRWSKEAEKVFGWQADEILGRAAPDIRWVYEEDAESVQRGSQDMISGNSPRNLSVNRNYRKDGTVIECEWYNSAIYDGSGKLSSILSQVLDVTERRRAEDKLRQTQKLESIGLLAGGIAHDFNNLLAGIMGHASMALEEVGPGPAEQIREVIAGAERAASLTRQLLAYSGKGSFVVRDLDVSEAVTEITGLVEFSIPRSVELAVTVQRRLPPVRMDPGQLQQILMNLVINAGEAIGEGAQGRITVATSMAEIGKPFVDAIGEEIAPGRYVSIEVRDNGPGIEDDKKSRIFEPFFTTKFIGRGLGLAAVAGILRAQRGGITLATALGRGCAFRVLLPVPGDRATPRFEQPSEASLGAILVVDDEASVRDFIAAALRRRGYSVLTASDGREALSICERENGAIDGLVLDVVMPVMSGNALLPVIKTMQPNLKVLLTSGYSESEARRLCADYPDAAFIQKPYTARQIVQGVDELLGSTRA